MNDAFSWQRAALDAPEAEALWFESRIWNFRELAIEIAKVAEELRGLGAGPGKGVALRAANGLRALFLAAATIELGATLILLHPRLTEGEERSLLEEARPLLLAREDGISTLADAAPMPPHIAVVMFTSGTSGKPRGALLARRALEAAVLASAARLPVAPGDRWLLCLPLCHIGGLSIVLRCLLGRASVVLAPGFRAEDSLSLISRHRPTLLSLVPTMLHRLLEVDSSNQLASIRTLLLGGAAAPAALLERCAQRGIPVRTTYGLTEACSQVATQLEREPSRLEPGVGPPLPGVQLRIADEHGVEVAPNIEGRILLQGPAMMDGYLHAPPLQGWFDTGDLGLLDSEGRLHLRARRSDLIVTGGENVYPAEVEEQLLALGGVSEAMVFGVPDPVWGQLVAVALIPTRAFVLEAFRSSLFATLAPHKRPRRYCLVDSLPTNSTGKPLRRQALACFEPCLLPL